MDEGTKQIGIRIPISMYQELKSIAKKKSVYLKKNITLTDIAIEAFNKFLDTSTPGLCPSCHTQNEPSAQFCSSCGIPLEEEGRESITELITTQQKLEAEIEELKKSLSLYRDVNDRMSKLEENMSKLKNKNPADR
jgi:predicted amidophosphoribosyltransferase